MLMKNTVKRLKLKINSIAKINKGVFLISFSSPYLSRMARAGNFLHFKIDGVILRRPFSIHKVDKDRIYILFKVKGRGTRALANYKKGMTLDVIGPLGKGFKISCQLSAVSCQHILVAGGIGVAPLVFLAQTLACGSRLQAPGSRVVLLGAKNKDEILCEKEFEKLGFAVKVATEDGSRGFKGTVNDLLAQELRTANSEQRRTIYACGPEAMFGAIAAVIKKYPNIDCQLSFEQFMGCGLGVCCACVVKTKQGYKKVCKDGPVFNMKDIW